MQFTMQSEYCVDSPSEIKNSLIIGNYRACERVIMNPVHFPKADMEYISGHYDFLEILVFERGLDSKIASLDMKELRSDELSEQALTAAW